MGSGSSSMPLIKNNDSATIIPDEQKTYNKHIKQYCWVMIDTTNQAYNINSNHIMLSVSVVCVNMIKYIKRPMLYISQWRLFFRLISIILLPNNRLFHVTLART